MGDYPFFIERGREIPIKMDKICSFIRKMGKSVAFSLIVGNNNHSQVEIDVK